MQYAASNNRTGVLAVFMQQGHITPANSTSLGVCMWFPLMHFYLRFYITAEVAAQYGHIAVLSLLSADRDDFEWGNCIEIAIECDCFACVFTLACCRNGHLGAARWVRERKGKV